MNNQENNHSHFSGFWLGVIVGAAIVFLFATKKGKRILKLISEEGIEKITEIVESQKFSDEDDSLVNETEVPEEPVIQTNGENANKPSSKKRRFFKRTK